MEALFFTDKQQVYKVRLAELEDGKVAQMGILSLAIWKWKRAKCPFMGHQRLQRFMLFFFQNGKCAKIPLAAICTKQNRRKLLKAYSDKEQLAKLHIEEETELAICTSGSRRLAGWSARR